MANTLCQGYDRVFGHVRNVAMQGKPSSTVEDEGSSAVEMRYMVCQSLEEVRSALQMEPSCILGLFEAGSHSCHKLEFLRSLNLTTHSLAILILAEVVTGSRVITNASLSVAAPQTGDKVEEFVGVYGDSYVTKVVTGAEYYAGFTYHALTGEEKMDVLAKLKADGVFSCGSWHSKVHNKIANFNASYNGIATEFCQSMRGISGVVLPDAAHVLDFVIKLPTLKIDEPHTLRFEYAGYEHAQGINDQACHFAPIIRNRSSIVEDTEFLSSLSQVICLENDVRALEAMLHGLGMYEGSVISFLYEVKGAVKADIAATQIMMHDFRVNAMKDRLRRPSVLKSLAYAGRVQSVRWTEASSVYIGGEGGGVQNYVSNVQRFMNSRRRIVSIQLRSGLWIDRIVIKYSNNDVCEWGGHGGGWSSVLHVREGVHFSNIRIKDNGQFVSYLQFVLTDGSLLCGGDVDAEGEQDVTYEPLKAPNFRHFCGFQARSGCYIDALRAIFAEFHI